MMMTDCVFFFPVAALFALSFTFSFDIEKDENLFISMLENTQVTDY